MFFCAEVRPGLTLSDSHASHLYRIAQEALANAARHGGATVVDVLLVITHSTLLLRIADDGIGMGAGPHRGMGLRIMDYRAGILGAKLEISAERPRRNRGACHQRGAGRHGPAIIKDDKR